MEDKRNKVPLWSRNFITVIISHFFLWLGLQMFLPTMPIYASTLGANETVIGLVAGLFTISAVIIRPFSGAFLDRFGRRVVLVISLSVFILTTLSYTVISTIGIFLIMRIIHGIGWGGSSTSSDTIATDNIPQKRFGEGMGFFGLSMSLGMAIGPAIGMSIANNYGFNAFFYVSAFFVLLSLVISSTIKFQDQKKEKTKKSLFSFEKESIEPAILMALITISYGAIVGFIPLYAQQQGIDNISSFFTIYATALLVTRPFLGRLVDKYGFDYIVIPGIILIFLSMTFLGLTSSKAGYLLIAVIYGIGLGACQLCFQIMTIINVSQDKRGGANAIFYVGFDGGITIGTILYGYLASFFGYSNMYLLTLIPTFLALAIYILRKKRYKPKT